MKKVFLIAAIACCLAICGTAFAVTYFSASDKEGTVTADQCFILDLDGSSADTSITVAPGADTVYKIACGVTKSASVANTHTGTLTVVLAAAEGKNLNGVTVTIYSDDRCTTPVADKSQSGAGTITITGINADTNYWAKVSYALPEGSNESVLSSVEGTMTVNFVKA